MKTADAVTVALRAWLHQRPEPPHVLAAALAYELTALVAKHASTKAVAIQLLATWSITMIQQVDALGVDVEHP